MLITFKTKSHAGLTMFDDVGKSMHKKMGFSGTILGAILAEDVPEHLNRLTKAINAANSQTPLN